MDQPLWTPDPKIVAKSRLIRFRDHINATEKTKLESYSDMLRYSTTELDGFWNAVWEFCGVIASVKGNRVQENPGKMPGTLFFPDARLNFAENLLRRRDDSECLVFRGEDKVQVRMTWAELYDEVARAAAYFKGIGLTAGDRVVAMMPNMPETIIAMLAATSLGAIWSSCSPDFGVNGVTDRFGQIDPKILIVSDGYFYNGKTIDITEKVRQIISDLSSLEKVLVVPYAGDGRGIGKTSDKTIVWRDALGDAPGGDIDFLQVPFNSPLYILFSSGTTGVPKCIVHSVGGVLLQNLKEHQLTGGLEPDERVFYFSTCGWMMWNWLAGALASECTLMLYDGSPFYPDVSALFDYAEAESWAVFGTSAKYIDAVKKSGYRPGDNHNLDSIRLICSTGSPLVPESFSFVYDAFKRDVHLASMSGGTDLCGCFVGADSTSPVWSGEIQAPSLGMSIEIWDDDGKPMTEGKGELVCTVPFPSMPLMFWSDEGGQKYHDAYFARYDNIWCQGDFAEWTTNGGIVIHGRSDATLNPGGVRIGTAEIYAQVEKLPEIVEALAIGQSWDNDTRVVLFVILAEGVALDDDLAARIKRNIFTGASPRHVPARIIAVKDIPRTKSGKITEIAVRDIVHGRTIKNREALANPEALDLFIDLPELQS